MGTFRKILIPTDDSDYSRNAVERGLILAKEMGAEVTALYVIDTRSFDHHPIVMRMMSDDGKEAVDFVRRRGEEMGVEVVTMIKEGSPGEIIADLSAQYDLVVMGTLGRTGISRLLMGSVAEHVVRHSNSPVMLVKTVDVRRLPTADEATAESSSQLPR